MSKLNVLARRLAAEESGTSMVEYSILIGLIAAALITSVAAVSTWMTGRWSALCTALSITCT